MNWLPSLAAVLFSASVASAAETQAKASAPEPGTPPGKAFGEEPGSTQLPASTDPPKPADSTEPAPAPEGAGPEPLAPTSLAPADPTSAPPEPSSASTDPTPPPTDPTPPPNPSPPTEPTPETQPPPAKSATPLVDRGLLGHFRIGASLTGSVVGGDFGDKLAYGSAAAAGPALDLGFGVGPGTMLGVYGTLGWIGEGSNCSACSIVSPGGGIFVRHHVVQGLRLDPWISYGVGIRAYDVRHGGANDTAIALEWMRATIGADWFITRALAFGPFLELHLATTASTSNGGAGQTLYEGSLGLRFALDIGGH